MIDLPPPVEAAARELLRWDRLLSWDQITDVTREEYVDGARAALRAAIDALPDIKTLPGMKRICDEKFYPGDLYIEFGLERKQSERHN